jgi:hypothetical protein
MPTYTFYDEASGIEWNETLTIADRTKFLEDNKHIRQVIVPVALAGDHLMGVGPKVDGGFTENMQRIAQAHPGSPLDDKFGGSTRTHTELKTRDAINKHRKTVERSGFSASKKKTL